MKKTISMICIALASSSFLFSCNKAKEIKFEEACAWVSEHCDQQQQTKTTTRIHVDYDYSMATSDTAFDCAKSSLVMWLGDDPINDKKGSLDATQQQTQSSLTPTSFEQLYKDDKETNNSFAVTNDELICYTKIDTQLTAPYSKLVLNKERKYNAKGFIIEEKLNYEIAECRLGGNLNGGHQEVVISY